MPLYPGAEELQRVDRQAEVCEALLKGRVPTHRYLRTKSGAWSEELNGLPVSLRTWVEGASLEGMELDGERLAALGELLGRMHRALAAFPFPGAGRDWSPQFLSALLDELRRGKAVIGSRGGMPLPDDAGILKAIDYSIEQLETRLSSW